MELVLGWVAAGVLLLMVVFAVFMLRGKDEKNQHEGADKVEKPVEPSQTRRGEGQVQKADKSAIRAFAYAYLEYDDMAAPGFEENERWIVKAKALGPGAIEELEQVIKEVWLSKAMGCGNLLYAIYRIGGKEGQQSLNALQQLKLSDGSALPAPTNSYHLDFKRKSKDWYEDLTKRM